MVYAPAEARTGTGETRRELRVWARPLGVAAVWGIVAAVLLVFFVELRAIALGIIAASAVAALLRPVVHVLPGPRTLRGAAVGVGFILLAIALVATLVLALAGRVAEQLAELPRMYEAINRILADLSFRLGFEEPLTIEEVGRTVLEFFSGAAGPGLLSRTTEAATAFVIALAFIFMGSLYMLIEPRGYLTGPLVSMLPERRRPAMRRFFLELEPRLRWWVLGTLTSMTLVGTLAGVGFTIVGLEFALPLALLMGLAEIVPIIGPLSAFIISLLFASAEGTQQMIGVVIVYAMVQLLEGYVVLPLIMRRAVKIPPVVTLFTVVLWGRIFGVAGFLLAIPLNLVVWGLVEQFLLPPPPPPSPEQPEPELRRSG